MKTLGLSISVIPNVFSNGLMRLRRVPHCDKDWGRVWMLDVRSATPGFNGWEPIAAVRASDFLMDSVSADAARAQQHCADGGANT